MQASSDQGAGSGLRELLRSGRESYAGDLRSTLRYWYFSAATYLLRKDLLPVIERYVSGRTLDAGAGGLHGRQLLEAHCAEYVSIDVTDQRGEIDLIGDLQDLSEIEDSSFDCIFCSQVLEHLPHPTRALAEFKRVLVQGGRVVISVPHLSALHEEPHDYFRYTPYGIVSLMDDAGFEVVELKRSGGLITFISHPVSYVLNTIG